MNEELYAASTLIVQCGAFLLVSFHIKLALRVLPKSREESLYPLRRHSVRTEDESHGEENGSGGRLVQEPAERLRQGRRSRLDLQAADIDKGGRQRARVVQHVVRVDEDAGQVPWRKQQIV